MAKLGRRSALQAPEGEFPILLLPGAPDTDFCTGNQISHKQTNERTKNQAKMHLTFSGRVSAISLVRTSFPSARKRRARGFVPYWNFGGVPSVRIVRHSCRVVLRRSISPLTKADSGLPQREPPSSREMVAPGPSPLSEW